MLLVEGGAVRSVTGAAHRHGPRAVPGVPWEGTRTPEGGATRPGPAGAAVPEGGRSATNRGKARPVVRRLP